jgi:hypothetical protein
MLQFKPKQTIKKIIVILPPRSQEIILQRYGLGFSPESKTLEAIGQNYNITRERVRQIENFSLNLIKKHDIFSSLRDTFNELKSDIEKKGGIVEEESFLKNLSDDPIIHNHIYFLLVLGDDFTKIKEDDEFLHRWTIDMENADNVHQVLRKLHKQISPEEIMAEEKIISYLKKHALEIFKKQKIENEMIRSWLIISKVINKNALGEWGLVSSPSINPRGMRDFAYLVIKKHGSPLHFNEVASKISEIFNRKAHPATTHNELIKDNRFVLVGRGLYALKEWGYTNGVVRDVIKNILKNNTSLSKEEIIKRVLKERYVKENTILVNLQNRNYFKRNAEGDYIIA